ncbi:MAG TPA: NrfD/PsrC family molybdoenzyme membrane anchor subunit [Miltoncostaeaceae bacterium]|nr:NrfD/PsrC family molybdoenzyme membrane anchor subunit [Miltoncostaeaceae bacterium]
MSGDRGAARGDAPQSYYGRPIIKPPVWTWEIGAYLFTGGLGGASATLSLAARAAGDHRLARTSLLVGAAADAASLPLLAHDLGRPGRFLNMLRMFKPRSPMSMGSWILAVSGTSSGVAAALEVAGRLPRLKLAAEVAAGLAGPALSTYTGVLLADTAVPAWHEARRELPAVFGMSAAASAGAAATLLLPPADAGPARRLAVAGVIGEGIAMETMERRIGFVGEPYRTGTPGRLARWAKALAGVGALLLGLRGRRSRTASVAGAAMVLAGEVCLRFCVFRAGFDSATDPAYTVRPQRERADARAAAAAGAQEAGPSPEPGRIAPGDGDGAR